MITHSNLRTSENIIVMEKSNELSFFCKKLYKVMKNTITVCPDDFDKKRKTIQKDACRIKGYASGV